MTPKIMSPDEELEMAIAVLLSPQLFDSLDTGWGHVPKERARHLRRARRLLKFVRTFDEEGAAQKINPGSPMTIAVPLGRLAKLVDWMQDEADNQTCSNLCDKTWESQGCPSGTCALEDGRAEIRWWANEIQKALDEEVK